MNNMHPLTAKQALRAALAYAGIEETESRCLLNRYDDGLYHLFVNTAYMKYEFYVSAADGEVLGFDLEAQTCSEALDFCGDDGQGEALAA